jgi:hypothetical protein
MGNIGPEIAEKPGVVRSIVASVTQLLPPLARMDLLLDELFREALDAAHKKVAQDRLARCLKASGRVAVAHALQHIGAVATASEIAAQFRVDRSTIHKWKKAGSVIALRVGDEDCFPTVQFAGGEPAPWAAVLVKVVGNGEGAIHFLGAPRDSLDGRSFAEAIEEGAPDIESTLESAVQRLASEHD